MLISATDGGWRAPAGMHTIAVNVPRAALPLADAAIDRVVGRPVPARAVIFESLVAPMLLGSVGQLGAVARCVDQAASNRSDLEATWLSVAALLLRSLDAGPADGVEFAPARRLQAQRFIAANLGDQQLNADVVARAMSISRCALYAAFVDGDGVAATIRTARLRRAHALLADPAQRDRTIADISAEVGMGPAHFSRLFRAEYGQTPRAVRRELVDSCTADADLADLCRSTCAPCHGGADRAHVGREARFELRGRAEVEPDWAPIIASGPGVPPPGTPGVIPALCPKGTSPSVRCLRDNLQRLAMIGTELNETFAGTPAADRITPFGGNDAVAALAGNDLVSGGIGDDRLDGGDGNDRLNGNAGADTLTGGVGDDSLSGAAGADRLTGSTGNDRLNGGNGRDRLNGGNGRDRLRGGAARDTLNCGAGRDRVFAITGDSVRRNCEERGDRWLALRSWRCPGLPQGSPPGRQIALALSVREGPQ